MEWITAIRKSVDYIEEQENTQTMNREQAKEIIYGCVFNGEYAANEKQAEAFFSLFNDEVNHHDVLHKLSHHRCDKLFS